MKNHYWTSSIYKQDAQPFARADARQKRRAPLSSKSFLDAKSLRELARLHKVPSIGCLVPRASQSHKRLMLLATIALLPPAIARWVLLLGLGPPVVFAVATLLLVPLIGWDLKTRRRLHPVTLWGGLLLVVSGPLRLMLAQTDSWLVISDWLVGLVK